MEEPAETASGFKSILTFLAQRKQIDFASYKISSLRRRISRRMSLANLKDEAAYLELITEDHAEFEALTQDLLIGVTEFFRDARAFEFLKRRIFPRLMDARAKRGDQEALRVWVPGCSTGQEAYSIAISWQEYLAQTHAKVPMQIFATDINEVALEKARRGVYASSLLRGLSAERRRRFFSEVADGCRVSKTLRDMCVFAAQDLLNDSPFSRMDLVVCRNLLIYLTSTRQKSIIPILHFALKPSGCLFLGPSETVGGFARVFDQLDPRLRFYLKRPGSIPLDLHLGPRRISHTSVRPAEPPKGSGSAAGTDVQREANRLALARYAPPGVVLNADWEVIQYRGCTNAFLQMPPGRPTLNVLKLAREGLFSPLRAALRQAAKTAAPVVRHGVELKQEHRTLIVDLEVVPLKIDHQQGGCFLVTFEPVDGVLPDRDPAAVTPGARGSSRRRDREFAALAAELAETREHLKSIIEEQDTFSEELQVANEEAQSSNEELQSTNEELETASEELQSSNEELTTVNEELRVRNEQVGIINNDFRNLLDSVHLPIVMLDRSLCIRRFTAAAEQPFNLVADDLGRPIGSLQPNLIAPNLERLVAEVIDTVAFRQEEVRDKEGRCYELRIRPYKTSDNKVDGAVLVLVDLDELKKSQQQIMDSRDFSDAIVQTVREGLVVLNETLTVRSANAAFYEMFRLAPREMENQKFLEQNNGRWNLPDLRCLLEGLLATGHETAAYAIEAEFPRIGRRVMQLNARRIRRQAGKPTILLAIADITESRAAEERVRRPNSELEHRVEQRTQELNTAVARLREEVAERKRLERDVLTVSEREQERIGHDLHDDLQQQLAGIAFLGEALSNTLRTKYAPEAAKAESIALLLRKSVVHARGLAHGLRPVENTPQGLMKALSEFVMLVRDMFGVRCEFRCPAPVELHQNQTATHLYRIAQEAIHNTIKHSGATRVIMELRSRRDVIELTVRDNGNGLSPRSSELAGMGLSTMRYRAQAIGGSLILRRCKPHGVVVICSIPK